MKIQDIQKLFTEKGIEADFRGQEGVQKALDRYKKQFEKLTPTDQADFDKEYLVNPYMDSGVLNVAEDKEIKRVLVGIDIEPAEILLAKQLGNIDLVIAHHPEGKALARLGDVMDMQTDILHMHGVPINVAENLMRTRIAEIHRGVSPSNHQRTVDMARILGVNLMVAHTSADNSAAKFIQDFMDKKKPERVSDVLDVLRAIPEYKESMKIGAGPTIFVGSPDNRAGKVVATEFTGGTNGSTQIYSKMLHTGIGTIVGMHMREDHRKEAEAAHLNIVIAGHMSSDSLGMNLLCDALEKQGVEIVPCSGFIRVSRN